MIFDRTKRRPKGKFPGHSNPPPPPQSPSHSQYISSPHYRRMRIKYENDMFMELIELLVNLDN